MRHGLLLVVVLSALLGSVAAVYAAPGDLGGGPTVEVGPSSVRGDHGLMSVPRGAAPPDTRPTWHTAARPSEFRLSQGTWVGMIDDFEVGAEPDPAKGWIFREDTNGPMFGEYTWGISGCRAASGVRSLWAIGDGEDGSQLACGSPYPHGASSSIWLNIDTAHWATDTMKLDLLVDFWLNLRTFPEDEVEADGLFIIYRLPTSDPSSGRDTTEPVVLSAITAKNPNSFWHEPLRVDLIRAREIYPQPDGSYREFNLAGKESVIIEFHFQSGMKTSTVEEDGVFIDNVRLESSAPGPGETPQPTTPTATKPASATPTMTTTLTTTPSTPTPTTVTPGPTIETPTPTDVPTGTTPVDIYLPIAMKNASFSTTEPGTPVPGTETAEPPPTGPVPSVEPTDEPTVEPTEDPGPGELECADIVINGGFEDGPDVGWALQSNATDSEGNPLEPADVILEYASFGAQLVPPPGGGDWLAFMGDVADVDMWLFQSEPVDTLPAQDVVSATLVINLGLLTDEAPDGEDNDFFGIYVINQDDDAELVEEFSEESYKIVAGTWNEVTVPGFELLLTAREGWETMRLAFRSSQDDEAVTQHALDNVTLEVCQMKTPGTSTARVLRSAHASGGAVTRPLSGMLRR